MEIFVGIIALIGGFILGSRFGAKGVLPLVRELSNKQAIDRANYLHTLRRELANILIWRDPERYFRLYEELHGEVASLESWRLEEVQKRLSELCTKYPCYSDFDAIGTRDYVLYSEGIMLAGDEIEARYKDLVMFAALSSIADFSWKDAASKLFVHTTSDRELKHLTKYVRRIEDTKLKIRLERAMEVNSMRRSESNATTDFENAHYAIKRLPHFAETRYAIHLKATNEFGIGSFFVFDDGRVSYGYYRSDATFAVEQRLNPLNAVVEELRSR